VFPICFFRSFGDFGFIFKNVGGNAMLDAHLDSAWCETLRDEGSENEVVTRSLPPPHTQITLNC